MVKFDKRAEFYLGVVERVLYQGPSSPQAINELRRGFKDGLRENGAEAEQFAGQSKEPYAHGYLRAADHVRIREATDQVTLSGSAQRYLDALVLRSLPGELNPENVRKTVQGFTDSLQQRGREWERYMGKRDDPYAHGYRAGADFVRDAEALGRDLPDIRH